MGAWISNSESNVWAMELITTDSAIGTLFDPPDWESGFYFDWKEERLGFSLGALADPLVDVAPASAHAFPVLVGDQPNGGVMELDHGHAVGFAQAVLHVVGGPE